MQNNCLPAGFCAVCLIFPAGSITFLSAENRGKQQQTVDLAIKTKGEQKKGNLFAGHEIGYGIENQQPMIIRKYLSGPAESATILVKSNCNKLISQAPNKQKTLCFLRKRNE